MLRLTRLVASVKRALIVVALVAVLPSLSIAEDGIPDELQSCAALDNAASRLACYDKLGRRQDSAVATVHAPVEPSPAEPPPDELGSESLNRQIERPDEPTSVAARVTRCTRDARKKKYFFYLGGGQVWKQVSEKRLYYKECDFNVTITKDFFGYKMQQEGEKAKIRVTRIR